MCWGEKNENDKWYEVKCEVRQQFYSHVRERGCGNSHIGAKNKNATLCCFATQHSANVLFLLVAFFSPFVVCTFFFAVFAFARACCVFVFISLENGAFILSLSMSPSLSQSCRTQFHYLHLHYSLPLHLFFCFCFCFASACSIALKHTHTIRTFNVSHDGGMFLYSPYDNIVCRYIFINILLFCSSNLTICASTIECHTMEYIHTHLEFRTVKCRRQ